MREFLSRNGHKDSEDDQEEIQEEVPPIGKRKAFGIANKPQTGVSLFSVKGKSRTPMYIQLVDMEQDGATVTLFFQHMKMTLVGKGLEALVEGLRRHVVYYIQCQHVSDFVADQEPHWVKSITVEKAAEAEELGKWTG